MPELRQDLITREWVVIAHERARRPSDFSHQREAALVATSDHAFCPFCPGHEAASPDEIASYREEGSGHWQVRVVANKFPALCPQDLAFRERHGLYDNLPGIGAHKASSKHPNTG
jgi:UDPglucose--hexose-1-phosphate uridylyltransferase